MEAKRQSKKTIIKLSLQVSTIRVNQLTGSPAQLSSRLSMNPRVLAGQVPQLMAPHPLISYMAGQAGLIRSNRPADARRRHTSANGATETSRPLLAITGVRIYASPPYRTSAVELAGLRATTPLLDSYGDAPFLRWGFERCSSIEEVG